MKRVLVATFIVFAAVWTAPAAEAACHAFTVGANASVTEGDQVSVVVQRDGSASDSSVRVRTVNGTAKAPNDFTALDERVEFTGDETEKTVIVQTKEDATSESNEAFTITLSEGQDCSNPVYVYGDPATVTIKDDDKKTAAPKTAAPLPTAPPATTIIPAQTRTPSPSPTGSASPTPSASATPTPSVTPVFTPVDVSEDGGFPWLPVLAIVGFGAAAAGALILQRMRSAGGAGGA